MSAMVGRLKPLLTLLGALALIGCGKEVGRLPFSAEATQSASVPLATGKVAFWTDLALSYEGPADLTYRIELEQAGHAIAQVECEALGQHDIKLRWSEIGFGDSRTLHGTGRMLCSAQLPKAGLTDVHVTLVFTTKPRIFTLTRADLVIKQ